MNTEFRTALFTKLKTISSKVVYDEALKDESLPYIVFGKSNGYPDSDSNEEYPKGYFQVVGRHNDLVALEVIETATKNLLHRKHSTFTLTDYNIVELTMKSEAKGKVENVYFFLQQYFYDLEIK